MYIRVHPAAVMLCFYGLAWILIKIICMLFYLQHMNLWSIVKLLRSPWARLERTWRRNRGLRAPALLPLGAEAKSPTARGDGFQIHKIHRIFHKWMNTISSQFPHYANMQNIESRPIRDSHSFKFTGLSRNCRNPQIITQLIGNICDRYNKFSSQITFHPRDHRAPVKSYRGLISLT